MAGSLTKKKGAIALGLLCGALAAAPWALAQGFIDPTRPSSVPASPQGAHTADYVAGPVLQSVLIAPGRRVAIISGQTVRLGETFGAARLEKISAGEVVLRTGTKLQTLKLFPGFEKQPGSGLLLKNRSDRIGAPADRPDSRGP